MVLSINPLNWPPHLHRYFVSGGEYRRHEQREFESTLGAQPGLLSLSSEMFFAMSSLQRFELTRFYAARVLNASSGGEPNLVGVRK